MKRNLRKRIDSNSKKRRISSDDTDSDDEDFIVDDDTIEYEEELEEEEEELEEEEEEEEEDEEEEQQQLEEEEEEDEEEDEEFMDYENFLSNLKETDEGTYLKFMEIKEHIDESLPNITDIINDEISVKNKARIVELYEVFKTSEPLTEEWLILKDRINMLIDIYREEYININSHIDIKHKIILIEKYEIFSTLVPFSEDWFD